MARFCQNVATSMRKPGLNLTSLLAISRCLRQGDGRVLAGLAGPGASAPIGWPGIGHGDVYGRIVGGKLNEQIANELGVALRTVRLIAHN